MSPSIHQKSAVWFCCLALAASSAASLQAASDSPQPPSPAVLVELFTSEGCSSCPPADRLLAALDRQQPVPGTTIVVLSEHVDYWDHAGWRDPFSSHQWTERQNDYGRQFGLDSVYTPQMVIDGSTQASGSDGRAVLSAIERSAKQPHIEIAISSHPAIRRRRPSRVHRRRREGRDRLRRPGRRLRPFLRRARRKRRADPRSRRRRPLPCPGRRPPANPSRQNDHLGPPTRRRQSASQSCPLCPGEQKRSYRRSHGA